jgi:hypothetical protein
VTISDPGAELAALADRYPDREAAIFSVSVEPSVSGSSRDEIARHIRSIFPRLFELKWAETAPENRTSACDFTPQADFASSVRGYLEKRLGDDPDKEIVLALADEFLRVEAVS